MTVRSFLSLVIVIGAFFLSFHFASASTSSARDVFVEPGESATLEIPIVNDTDRPLSASTMVLMADLPENSSSQPQLLPLSSDLARWVSLVPSSVTVDPESSTTLQLSVHPDRDIQTGIYTVAVVASQTIEGAVPLRYGNATLVFITVGQFSAVGTCESWDQGNDGTLSLTLHNTGEGILYESGVVELRGLFGFLFASASLNPEEHRVLPGQVRTWSVDPPRVPWWAFGPLSLVAADDQLSVSCVPVSAGFRWGPCVVGSIILFGLCAFVFRRWR